jgi:hypothetical protein
MESEGIAPVIRCQMGVNKHSTLYIEGLEGCTSSYSFQ